MSALHKRLSLAASILEALPPWNGICSSSFLGTNGARFSAPSACSASRHHLPSTSHFPRQGYSSRASPIRPIRFSFVPRPGETSLSTQTVSEGPATTGHIAGIIPSGGMSPRCNHRPLVSDPIRSSELGKFRQEFTCLSAQNRSPVTDHRLPPRPDWASPSKV